MQHYDGEYSGAALNSFIKGLNQSPAVIERILKPYGMKTIDPEQWYPLDQARAIYYDLEREVGSNTLYNVGIQMIESAPFPPEIDDVPTVLQSLNHAYVMNVRGPQIGGIDVEFDSDDSALVIFSTPFPCHLEKGIVVGCCQKFHATPLLEHEADGCRDDGAEACHYRVSW